MKTPRVKLSVVKKQKAPEATALTTPMVPLTTAVAVTAVELSELCLRLGLSVWRRLTRQK